MGATDSHRPAIIHSAVTARARRPAGGGPFRWARRAGGRGRRGAEPLWHVGHSDGLGVMRHAQRRSSVARAGGGGWMEGQSVTH